MSVVYYVHEHLIVKDRNTSETDFRDDAVCYMSDWLTTIAALMVRDVLDMFKLECTCDDQKFSFSGSCPNEVYKEMLDAADNADYFEIVMDYRYTAYFGMKKYFSLFELSDYIGGLSQEEMAGIFYSIWNNADCANSAGTLMAFGEKNGRLYFGDVPFRTVTEPTPGEWYADTDIMLDTDGLDSETLQKAVEICRKLNELPIEPAEKSLDTSENGIFYYLNDAILRTPEDYRKLTTNYAELHRLIPETGYQGEYVDQSGADVRLMHITYDDEGNPTVKIAEIVGDE